MKNIISQLRRENKITQEELVSEIGMTRQTITSIRNGRYTASLPLTFRIVKFFGMKIEDIFTMEGDD